MKVICSKCGFIIDRDKIIAGQIVEEYKNIYGTRCPSCGKLNKPSEKPVFITDKEIKMELLKEKVRNKLRNNKEIIDGN
jgi:uncharacterized OB-fold protein